MKESIKKNQKLKNGRLRESMWDSHPRLSIEPRYFSAFSAAVLCVLRG
jgi:hypothetical protein